MLTHVSEVIRNNLTQLLSYKDARTLLDRLERRYRRREGVSDEDIAAVQKVLAGLKDPPGLDHEEGTDG